jgi:hypothetical protein
VTTLRDVFSAGLPLSWNSIEKTMEERPDLWRPDLWRRNSEAFPLRDQFDLEPLVRRSAGPSGGTKELEELRSQAEV